MTVAESGKLAFISWLIKVALRVLQNERPLSPTEALVETELAFSTNALWLESANEH